MSDAPAPRLHLDVLLRPHRSLSRRGLAIVLGVLLAYNLLIALFLFAIGAFPVPIFLGLDFIGVLIAFTVSNRRAQRGERVRVSGDEVSVAREGAGAPQPVWRSATAFTRVEVETDAEDRIASIRLRQSARRSPPLAAALAPSERRSFVDSLRQALRTALAERHA